MTTDVDGAVPFTRPALPHLPDVLRLVEGIWGRGVLTNGGPVQLEFERALTRQLGWPPTAAVASGSAALRLLGAAAGLSGEVVVPSFTHAATGQALIGLGVTPVTADVSPDDLTIDVASVEASITPRTSGILATHTFGHPADVDALREVAARHGLVLLLDGAAAAGVRYRDRPLTAYGDGCAVSFHATKILNGVEGGAVTSPDAALVDRVRTLRNFGMSPGRPADPLGSNGKTNELCCAVALLALGTLGDEIEGRARAVQRYRRELAGLDWVSFPQPRPLTVPNHGYACVRLRTPDGHPLADRVDAALRRAGVESRRYFAGPYSLATEPGRDPRADAARADVLCLPLWGTIPPATIDRVCRLVRDAGSRPAGDG